MILVNTVGTSLLGAWREFGTACDEVHRDRLVRAVLNLPESDRRLGAELTSIRSLIKQDVVRPGHRLVFLVSDTKEGRFVGEVLVQVAEQWGFLAEQRTIHKLQGTDPKPFAQGLRNLVKEVAMYARKAQNGGDVLAINATGGYKAQISFAGLIGQVFQVPVYYQFEEFPAAMKLPPLPVSFDLQDWLSYRDVFEALEEGDDGKLLRADDSRVKALPERLQVLLDRSQGFATLNALGTLYHTGLAARFAAQAGPLLPRASGLEPEAKTIRYEDANPGKHRGLAEFFDRLRRVPYVLEIRTIRYVPEKPHRPRFRPDPASGDRLKGTYWDGTVAVEFWVQLSESHPEKAKAAAADLASRMA